MARNTFTTASLQRTQAALRAAQAKVALAAPKAEEAAAVVIAREMAARAPVRTGALRASIRAQGSQAVAGVSYAVPVNSGTVNMAPQPFATEGAKAAVPLAETAMAAVFRAALGGI